MWYPRVLGDNTLIKFHFWVHFGVNFIYSKTLLIPTSQSWISVQSDTEGLAQIPVTFGTYLTYL